MEEKIEQVKIEKINKDAAEKKQKVFWTKMRQEEVEKIIIDLGKQGENPAKIGSILRDKYGVPKTKIYGKKICQILNERGIKYEKERDLIDKKVRILKKHIIKNKHDYNSFRALTKKLWVINRINKIEN